MTSEVPAGLVPPPVSLSGLTEIRVHGVGGTPPTALLGDRAPTRVAGDRVAGFYRTTPAAGRNREAYSWGGLTSLSPTRALWALLLPAMFANMAGWMSRPVPGGPPEEAREPTTWAFRWGARLAALGLTLPSSATVAYLLVDVLAYRCGGAGACEGSGWASRPLEAFARVEQPGHRVAAAAGVALVVVLLFVLLAHRTRSRYERVEPPSVVPDSPSGVAAGTLGGDPATTAPLASSARCAAAQAGGLRSAVFWSGARWHVFLTRLHVAAALAVVAIVVGAGTGPAGAWAVVPGAGLLVLVGGALAWDDAHETPATALLVAALLVLVVATTTAGASDAIGPGQPGAGLPGAARALGTFWVAAPVLLLPLAGQQLTALIRAPADAPGAAPPVFPRGAPVVLSTAGHVAAAAAVLLSGLGYAAEHLSTAAVRIALPGWIAVAAGTLCFGLLIALAVFGVLLGVSSWLARHRDAAAVRADLTARYPEPAIVADPLWWRSAFDPPMSGTTAVASDGTPTRWLRWATQMRFLARHTTDVAWLMVAVAAVGVVVLVVTLGTEGGIGWIVGFGMDAAVLIPPLYVLVLMAAWRSERWRRVLGTLFDVGSFFPRSFHPFAPPSYAERAVPELTRRIWRLQDNGGRVVLTAHSQGSVIAAAVLAREPASARPPEPTVGLVTLGSPLGKLYRWAFPALFSDELLQTLASGVPGFGAVAWDNVFYRTDYIGGPVSGPWWDADQDVDTELVDPPTPWYVADQPMPPVLSHTGYWNDPAFWTRVDAMSAVVKGG